MQGEKRGGMKRVVYPIKMKVRHSLHPPKLISFHASWDGLIHQGITLAGRSLLLFPSSNGYPLVVCMSKVSRKRLLEPVAALNCAPTAQKL